MLGVAWIVLGVAAVTVAEGASAAQIDDNATYDEVLFLGTHNSAINLGGATVGRPTAAVGGAHPSEAHAAYQYLVMDQRLSIRDQVRRLGGHCVASLINCASLSSTA
jgi:hypothetical protein